MLKGKKGMATTSPKRPIFRSKTLQTYIQNREKSVLPRIITPPVFALSWIVLALLIAAGITIWYGQVPVYITGSGIIPEPLASSQQETDTTAIILFPISDIAYLQADLPIQIQIDPAGSRLVFNSRVVAVSQSPLSPDEIHLKYGLEVAAPAVVVTATLGTALSRKLYAGSLVQAQLQIGSQSLLSLFPVLNSF